MRFGALPGAPGGSERGSRGHTKWVERSSDVTGARAPVCVGLPTWSRTSASVYAPKLSMAGWDIFTHPASLRWRVHRYFDLQVRLTEPPQTITPPRHKSNNRSILRRPPALPPWRTQLARPDDHSYLPRGLTMEPGCFAPTPPDRRPIPNGGSHPSRNASHGTSPRPRPGGPPGSYRWASRTSRRRC